MSQQILDALAKLDPANEAQWNVDGTPKLEAVRWLGGDQAITRGQIISASPDFNRSNAVAKAPPPPETSAPDVTATQTVDRKADDPASPEVPAWAKPRPIDPAFIEPAEEDDEKLTRLKSELRDMDSEVQHVHAQLAVGQAYLRAKHTERDHLIQQIERLTPKNLHQSAVTAYLNSQKNLNATRAEAQAKVREQMRSLGTLAVPLPVDIRKKR